MIHFENNKWISTSVDKNGKKSVVTRYVDDKGQQMIVSDCLVWGVGKEVLHRRTWNVDR